MVLFLFYDMSTFFIHSMLRRYIKFYIFTYCELTFLKLTLQISIPFLRFTLCKWTQRSKWFLSLQCGAALCLLQDFRLCLYHYCIFLFSLFVISLTLLDVTNSEVFFLRKWYCVCVLKICINFIQEWSFSASWNWKLFYSYFILCWFSVNFFNRSNKNLSETLRRH